MIFARLSIIIIKKSLLFKYISEFFEKLVLVLITLFVLKKKRLKYYNFRSFKL